MLRAVGVATIASHFPGFAKWAYAGAHAHSGDGPAPVHPTAYKPQFFTADEYSLIERLTELIIPTDETPGAREAGVAEFVDFMVAHDRDQQTPLRAGLAWLEAYAQRTLGQPFRTLSGQQQSSVLEPLAYESKYREDQDQAQEFFRRIKELTLMGFYSSEIGYRELDNPALRLYSSSPACPHANDPEHRHLPPAKG